MRSLVNRAARPFVSGKAYAVLFKRTSGDMAISPKNDALCLPPSKMP